MSKSTQAAKSVAVITVFTIGSKFLGFFREMLIASKFGSGVETDTFFMALSATTLLTSLLQSAINTTTIPVLSEVEALEGKEGKKAHTSNLVNIVLLAALALVVFGLFAAPIVVRIIAFGFSGEQYRLAIKLVRIGLPVALFSCTIGVFRGYLHSEMKFFETAATSFPFNFVYIFFLLFLAGTFGIKGLMVTSVLAVASQFLIQLPGLIKTGYRYTPVFNLKDKYIDKILKLVPPVFIGVAVRDINVLIDKSLASSLPTGSISALNYANRLNVLILGVFIASITTVLYPMLAKEASAENHGGLKKVLAQGANVIVLITVPATVGMVVLARPIVAAVFQRGAFDAVATGMTTGALIFYSLGLVGMALKSLLNYVYYSLQDTRTPMYNSFIAVAINIGANLILIRFLAHQGLALATSISSVATAALLAAGLRKKIGGIGGHRVLNTSLKCLVAAGVMGGVAYFSFSALSKALGSGFAPQVLALAVAVTLAAGVYGAILVLLRVEEVSWLAGLARHELDRRGYRLPWARREK